MGLRGIPSSDALLRTAPSVRPIFKPITRVGVLSRASSASARSSVEVHSLPEFLLYFAILTPFLRVRALSQSANVFPSKCRETHRSRDLHAQSSMICVILSTVAVSVSIIDMSSSKSPTSLKNLYALVGARIREARLRSEKPQDELAKAVGLQRTSITNIERGKQKLTLDNLYLIAEELGVDPHSLLPGIDELSRLTVTTSWESKLSEPAEDWVQAVLKKAKVED